MEFFASICPLTGLFTDGKATTNPAGTSVNVLYKFKPIGQAIFSFQTALALTRLMENGTFQPRFDLAGLSRQAAEKGEPALVISNEVFGDPRNDVPKTFEEKREHFLRLLYETGGREYKERGIDTFEDFPMAFAANAKEFYRIIKSLLADNLIEYDESCVVQGDWVDNIQAHYHDVLPTGAAKFFLTSSKSTVATAAPIVPVSLATLHPSVQQAAGSRFASAHYADAISAACTALDKAVAAKAQRPDLNGKQLMDVAFTPKNPLVRLSPNDNEQTGFMLLYQGVMQAIRNHYAHNLTEVPATRALEWLGFISALFYKLDQAQLPATLPTL